MWVVRSGIRVRLTNSDSSSVTVMVIPTSLSQVVISFFPPKRIGANTMTEVSVAETTARPTSSVPLMVAVSGSSPMPIRR